MNLICTRAKQEFLNVFWEPFATSTPLKAAPDNRKIENGSLKQLLMTCDSLNFASKLQKNSKVPNFLQEKAKAADCKSLLSKRSRRNKSSALFDLSSSSDEDSLIENKRPVIKLSSVKKAKSLLNNKLNCNETKVVENISTNKILHNYKKINISDSEKSIFSPKELKPRNDISQKRKNKTQNSYTSSYEINKIFEVQNSDSRNISNNNNNNNNTNTSLNSIRVNSRNKKKSNHSKHDEDFKLLNNSDEIKAKKVKKVFQISPLLEKSVDNDNDDNNHLQNLKISHVMSSENAKLPKPQKAKNKNISFHKKARTRTTKINDKLIAQATGLTKNTVIPLHLREHKTNLTHELFSDSKEQEFINTLNLTAEEDDAITENTRYSRSQKQKTLPCKLFLSSHPSSHEVFNNKINKKESKKRKQNPKIYNMLKTSSDEPLVDTDKRKQTRIKRNLKISAKNGNIKKPEPLAKSKKVARGTEEKNISDKLKNTNSENGLSCLDSNQDKNKPEFCESSIAINKAINKKKSVFKVINELSYKESETGCSVVQCWNMNTFKCGVFKLKIKGQVSCKTLHTNSHLGGVLIKGTLKMKIGKEELNLKKGDMAFVPPLTEWQATNIGECESVFYYWCGRFKIHSKV